jgi:hypothetical protein
VDPKDAITLFMTIEALLLAASAVGVAVVRSKGTGESVGYARALAYGCTGLTVLLSIGGFLAWLDLVTHCSTAPTNGLQWAEVWILLATIVALPVVAYLVSRGAK